jgi:hypothetical protein
VIHNGIICQIAPKEETNFENLQTVPLSESKLTIDIVPLRIFLSYWGVIIASDGLQILSTYA